MYYLLRQYAILNSLLVLIDSKPGWISSNMNDVCKMCTLNDLKLSLNHTHIWYFQGQNQKPVVVIANNLIKWSRLNHGQSGHFFTLILHKPIAFFSVFNTGPGASENWWWCQGNVGKRCPYVTHTTSVNISRGFHCCILSEIMFSLWIRSLSCFINDSDVCILTIVVVPCHLSCVTRDKRWIF